MAQTAATAPAAAIVLKKKNIWLEAFLRLVKEKPMGTVGFVIVLILLITGIFANLIAPYGFNELDMAARLAAPSGKHFLGTDNLGRDLLSRIIFGARISMYVSIGSASLAVAISLLLGGISGFFMGKTDVIMQRFIDAFMALPFLFLVLTIMAVTGPGLIQVILVLGFVGGIGRSRVVRSAVISIRQNMYVQAAEAIGGTSTHNLIQHILPNILAPVIVLFTIDMGVAIITESTISFLGFGIPPPMPSWGGMLSESGRKYMLLAPWMAIWPGVALSLVVWGINMFGDGLRDVFDPRLRGGLGRYGRAVGIIGKGESEGKKK